MIMILRNTVNIWHQPMFGLHSSACAASNNVSNCGHRPTCDILIGFRVFHVHSNVIKTRLHLQHDGIVSPFTAVRCDNHPGHWMSCYHTLNHPKHPINWCAPNSFGVHLAVLIRSLTFFLPASKSRGCQLFSCFRVQHLWCATCGEWKKDNILRVQTLFRVTYIEGGLYAMWEKL